MGSSFNYSSFGRKKTLVIKRNEPMFEQTINSLSKQITEECIKIFDDSDKFFRIIDSPELDVEEWTESQQQPD